MGTVRIVGQVSPKYVVMDLMYPSEILQLNLLSNSVGLGTILDFWKTTNSEYNP